MVEDVYGIEQAYLNAKDRFIHSNSIKAEDKFIKIRPKNKDLAIQWLNIKEKQLRNKFGYDKVAVIRYSKTLYKEMNYLKNLLYWFHSKDFSDINEKDIENLYEGIEKGTIKQVKGKPLSLETKRDYYKKVFKGKNTFFCFIKKDDLTKRIIERRFQEEQEVRFFDEDTLKIILNNSKLLSHKVAFWLMFDTGIEVSAITQVVKSDFTEEYDAETKQTYFKVLARKEISKKNRQRRHLDILDPQLNILIKDYLNGLKDDKLFNFNPPALHKALKQIVRKLNLRTKGETAKEIMLKDFRSSMATNLLRLRYSTDYIKVRLGHRFSSNIIDRYVSYLGINQEKVRKEYLNDYYQDLETKYNDILMISKKQQDEINNLNDKQTAFSIVIQSLFEGFNAGEISNIINEERKKKGLPTFEEEAKKLIKEYKNGKVRL